MTPRTRFGLLAAATTFVAMTSTLAGQRGEAGGPPVPDFDVRDSRAAAAPSPLAATELQRRRADGRLRGTRAHPHTGAIRVLDLPGAVVSRSSGITAIRSVLAGAGYRLGLDSADVTRLEPIRDYVSASNGLRHIVFAQSFDGIPVFEGVTAIHIDRRGRIVRLTSNAARGAQRSNTMLLGAEQAAALAVSNVVPDEPFTAVRQGDPNRGPQQRTRFARGRLARDVTAQLTWFAMEGGLRLAWHVELEPAGDPQYYDVLVDAATGEVLLRRNRVRYSEGSGRVIQSNTTQALDPRRPDPRPAGASGCPPVQNHLVRSLTASFRDPGTVLFNSGRLHGNNTHVFLGGPTTEAPAGTFDGSQWSFEFPFNSAGAAATNLFFAVNYAHDFFYDLGFDEAAGNFQEDNFGRGGTGGDGVRAVARAAGRNNATFQPAPEGSRPTISIFMWDGTGCWAQDADGDGTSDIDGNYDLDIVLHEFHHGVSHRLNTAFTGSEADAIGEGAGDFFAYSVNGDTTLADYSRPGGIRGVNGKTYADWFCLLGVICEPHANGEIFANVLWDARERFRRDLVKGSAAAAINESHQLYIDALKLSAPAPTMLDVRDAMLLADELRNPGTPRSANFCRLWESFAGRGMGVDATDTADNGFNQVAADFSVPDGCVGPPPPPTITVSVPDGTANEDGPSNGAFTISRGEAQPADLPVRVTVGGSARNGTDYATIPATVTIPAGAASVTVQVAPVDDALLESNETVVLTVRTGPGYVVGAQASGTVTLLSDDTAPDLVVTIVTAPPVGGAGLTLQVTDTSKNQGTGESPASVTAFYLSSDVFFDEGDPQIGSRNVPVLAVGATHTVTTSITLPASTPAGSYRLVAKADGPGALFETNELNNLRSVSIRVGPDLVVQTLTVPPTGASGSSIAVTETTQNIGAGSAGQSTTTFYLSPDRLLGTSDTKLPAQRTVGPLGPGGASIGTTTMVLPTGISAGLWYVIASADDPSVVGETVETNNSRYATIAIGPDLDVLTFSGPAAAVAGATVTTTDGVKNTGSEVAPASITRIYLSLDLKLDTSDVHIGERAVPALMPNASSTGTASITIPADASGRYYLLAVADGPGTIGEVNEGNNVMYRPITIGQ